jgi:PIN domain nuclease of toxin-antitoxin system
MTQYVTDTMAIVLYLSKRRFSLSAKQLFQSADVGLCEIIVPSVVLFEIGYLFEKNRIDVSLADLRERFSTYPTYREQPLTLDIIDSTFGITDIPELHDRLIAGTARFLNAPLITNDPTIRASSFLITTW